MILVTRFNGSQYYINPELILCVESTPDTVITLTNHEKMIIKEPAKQIMAQFIAYQQKVRSGLSLETDKSN